jgi:TRAP transporter TAXI family solute receptor
MVKRKLLAALLLLPLAAAAGLPVRAETRLLTIGTGNPTGVYFAAGNAICRVVHNHGDATGDPSLRCLAPSSAGSLRNIEALLSGDIDVAIVQSDVAYGVLSGINPKAKELRSLFSLHAEPYQLVAAGDAQIARWDDLRGKRFNIGNPGSGNRRTNEVLMAAHRTPREAFALTTELPPAEQTKALCDDRIDAFGFVAGVPNASVAAAIEKCGATLAGLDSPVDAELAAKFPYFGITTIRKGAYRGIDRDIDTLSTFATVLVRPDLPDATVAAIMAAVFDMLDTFRAQHPALHDLDPAQMARRGLVAPFHPAALEFLRARQLTP